MRAALIKIAGLIAVASVAVAQPVDDPYLWLEEIEGQRSLAQVKTWNAATERTLRATPGFEERRERALTLLNDPNRIAMPDQIWGDTVFNHWIDSGHPRGLWRASPLGAYLAGKPQWRTLIDVDALGKAEDKSWVWHGADCLAPEYRRCLVSLSPGGTDADVLREFNLDTGKFVSGGFTLPVAKSNAAWMDADRLAIGTDFGEGSLTASGYPRIVKIWKRGTPLQSAITVFTGEQADVSASAFSVLDGDSRWTFINRSKTFWTNELLLVLADGRAVKTPLPETADYRAVLGGRLIAFFNAAAEGIPAGSIASYSLADIAAGRAVVPELVMAPTRSQAIEEVTASDNVLWVKALDDVSGKLFALRREPNGRWSQRAMPLPANSTIGIAATADEMDTALVTIEGMLSPTSLMAVGAQGAPRTVQALPAQFAAENFAVEQRFARSKDGTRVPYFLVRRKSDSDAPVPALIHAYGGFRAAQTPTYLTAQPYRAGPLGLFWAEDGGAYVLANIRGGGEYGPQWHEAALREKRQNSFDDLHAVAEDLVRAGISPKGRIAISGRSNGGVLVGAAMNQRPDLYGAVISGSPLIDMKRYTKLLAGASWIDEYGDPDKPEDWAFMSRYSPYQNVRPGVRYPPTFFYLSTKDDRVHPGRARKMAARLKAFGNPVYYHEYLEGGHSVGADRSEDAMRAALLWAFLTKEIVSER